MRNEIKRLLKDGDIGILNCFRYIILKKESPTEEEIENTLVEYMKKEVKSLKLCNVKEFEHTDIAKLFKTMRTLKPNVGYIIEQFNLNMTDLVLMVDLISSLFNNVWLIKPVIDDNCRERLVLLCEGRNNNETPGNDELPINQEELINFLYAIYGKALFELKATDEEFKKIVQNSVKVLNIVKLF